MVCIIALIFSLLAPITAATPIQYGSIPLLHRRQPGNDPPAGMFNFTTKHTSHEYTENGCRPIIMFWARGSTELGNMGMTLGPGTSDGIKHHYGIDNVATEGIDYDADLWTNAVPGGADLVGIRMMRNLLLDAAAKCEDSKIVAGGFSQGAALTHRAVEKLPKNVQEKIVAIVTYGDTQNLQDMGKIPNFPEEKVRVFCNIRDKLCHGTLELTGEHFAYDLHIPTAVAFLIEQIGELPVPSTNDGETAAEKGGLERIDDEPGDEEPM